MRILITANVLGGLKELKEDAEFSKPSFIFIVGNVGMSRHGEFWEYLDGDLKVGKDIYYVTGKYEDFALLKDLKEGKHDKGFYFVPSKKVTLTHPEKQIIISGLSGTYSPTFYEKETAPSRHFTKKQLFGLPEEADILLLHNVPGKLAKSNSLDFHEDVFRFIDAKRPRYIFIGGYDRFSHFNYHGTTVVFLTSLRKGYALVDTSDWSCFFQHKVT